ncbi:uncharacterized protein N7469_007772 [Penicillium citrinum]|uniref:PLC-like phosphodiesterase n=2 Tax=Penicillium TaxID=5073 RepID=A0A9W9TIZ2_PENCI|nr:uncharacterized protein N7469_007772 [Penicillium citrinum]KAJ5224269.1 hypothetical protein N7469_007772 [Penicillium citrinum]KAJ5574516.1 hypothetical protein N7450_008415 [Penicillium hetheringtonii]
MSHNLQRLLLALCGTLLLSRTSWGAPSADSLSSRKAASTDTTASTCNGHSEYCDRSYSNITFVGSHDSPFVGKLPQQNQNIDIKKQLDMGVRYLQAQTHHSILDKNVLQLCHTSCILEDAGTLKSFLDTVKDWLDANPNEVITLLLTNGDSVDITEFGDTFHESGISDYAFVPSSTPNPLSIDKWPTIGELISSGKRLVVFLDYGADANKVDFILNEFNYYFETAYDVTDSSFSNCSIDRPSGASASGRMYIVNHFLDVDIFGVKVPDRKHASETNAATGDGSIGAQASLCEGQYHRAPNVVLLDFVDKGDAIKAQIDLNGL